MIAEMAQVSETQEVLRMFREDETPPLKGPLDRALKAFRMFEIPHLICGGYAVQEYGFIRRTVDVDIIVPDVDQAREKLLMCGFRPVQGSKMTVKDSESPTTIDLWPGGRKDSPQAAEYPLPRNVSDEPQFVSLEELISMKLASYWASPILRGQDQVDVVQLIVRNDLGRDYIEQENPVSERYRELWDRIQIERNDPGKIGP
jgi:hypothetical protein